MAEMNQTPKGMRVHIGIFGRRNAGKSSVINALTKQNIALGQRRCRYDHRSGV